MAIDETLSAHVRAALSAAKAVREVKMFGGVGFMLNGNMVAVASHRGLLVRVGEDGEREALGRPGAESMVMGGRKMTGYVRVQGDLDGRAVKEWLRLARVYVDKLPTKTKTLAAKANPASATAKRPKPVKRSSSAQKSKRTK